MNTIDSFFDELKRRLEYLKNNSGLDNESTRHDRIIYPVFTNPNVLGWDCEDIWGQSSILVPNELKDEYFFSGGTPKNKRPDLIIRPKELSNPNVAATIIEEKRNQESIDNLKNYGRQIIDYLGLFNCTWGILTDGEKWLIKKGFEDYMVFNDLNELKKSIRDFKHVFSKQNMLHRYRNFQTFDLIYFRNHPSFLSPYAVALIEKLIPIRTEDLELKLIQDIYLHTIAFLDLEYHINIELPFKGLPIRTNHGILWKGKTSYIIEAINILACEKKCKSVTLSRTPESLNEQFNLHSFYAYDFKKWKDMYVFDKSSFEIAKESYNGLISYILYTSQEMSTYQLNTLEKLRKEHPNAKGF